jgi:hypothetical protein
VALAFRQARLGAIALVTLGICATIAARPVFAADWCRSTTCKGAGCSTDIDGCPTTGKPLWWGRRCVGFSLNQTGTRNLPMDQVRVAVEKAFATWSGVQCPGGKPAGISVGELQQTPCGRSEYDPEGKNVNVIVFRDDRWDFKGVDDNVAKTVVHFDADTGEILDADIEINTAHNQFTVSPANVVYDLQTVLTHEIGHFLGFAHSPLPYSVMFPSYQKGTLDGRKLAPEDIAELCTVYPPDRPGTCDLAPKGGLDLCQPVDSQTCSAGRSGRASQGWLPLALTLGGLWSKRMRTRGRTSGGLA